MLAIYLRNSPMLDNNVESFVTLTKPCKGIAEYTFLLCNSTPIRARCELRFSVDLKSKWFALGGQHWQQQQELDDLLPIIAYAGALIVEKMALFNHYNRQVRAEVTQNKENIGLRVIISKIAPKRVDLAWLKASYTMSDGRLSILTHKLICRDTRADPEEIARHFVTIS